MNEQEMKKDMPKVSVIVPVYNSEQSLPACIDALLRQSYNNLEILLIDDGSTDGGARILKSYAAMDPRIVYIHQRNRGVSAARNEGLRRVSGKYVLFADSDDCYTWNAAELLVRTAEETQADWIVGAVRKTLRGVTETVQPGTGVFSGEAMNEVLWRLLENYMIRQLWGKLYLAEIIRKYELRMREDMNCGEDFEWICRYLMHVQAMAALPEVVYHYRIKSNASLSQRFDMRSFHYLKLQYEAVRALLVSRGMWQVYEERILYHEGQEVCRGYGKIAAKNCPLPFREKIAYIRDGLRSPLRQDYLRFRKRLLPFAKDLMLRAGSACFVTLAVLILRRSSI